MDERSPAREIAERNKTASRVTVIGLAVNLVLVAIKYAAGFMGASGAMIADATHSLSDMITDVALLCGFFFVGKPADRHHRYGHGKIETLVAAFCGGVLFIAATGILASALLRIYQSIAAGLHPEPPGGVALIAALVSIVLKEWLYRYTAATGKRLNSPALIANAWHHRSDAFSSIGTAIGVGGAILGGRNFAILDPIAAALVSIFIFKAAWSITTDSLQELIEASIGEEGERVIRDIIASQPGVLGWHAVRSRRIGYYIAVEAHVLVDRRLGIVEAHDIATGLERRLRNEFGRQTHINIHVEPEERS